MLLKNEREQVIEIAKKAKEAGLVKLTAGNFSLRDSDTGYMAITPSGIDYDSLKPADIIVMDLAGRIIDSERKPSIETNLHRYIYQKREDVFGICHTHSVFATAWASIKEEFPVIVAELAALVGDKIEKVPFKPMGTIELANAVVETLGDQDAVLLANHGQVTVGASLHTAFINAVMVEDGAQIAYYAQGLGQVNILPPEECQALRKWMKERYGQ